MGMRNGRDGARRVSVAAKALGVVALGWGVTGCAREVRAVDADATGGAGGSGGVGSTSAPPDAASTTASASTSTGGADPWESASESELFCERHTATAIGEGRVLIVGQCTAELWQGPSAAVVYELSTHTFSPVVPQEGRAWHAAARLPDGRVALVGESPHVEYFDPATDTFTLGPLLGVPRHEPTLVALLDGRVRVLGGRTADGEPLASTEIVDPIAGTSVEGPPLLEARYGAARLPLPAGGVWILGGASVDVDAWSTEALESTERSVCGGCGFTSSGALPGLAGELSAIEGGGAAAVFGTYALAWRDGVGFGAPIDHATEILGAAAAYTPTGRFVAAGTAIYQSQIRVLEATPGGGAHLVATREGSGFTSLTALGGDALLVVSGRAAIVNLP